MSHLRARSLCVAAWFAGCAPAASSTPLANAAPEGHDVYFYGDARGGKDLPQDDDGNSKESATKPSAKATASAETSAKPASTEAPVASASATSTEAAKLPPLSFTDLPGRYKGTDTLTIEIEGMPKRVEKDDGAKLTVEKDDGTPDSFVFKIVDSGSGADLCAVKAVAKEKGLEFESGQSCLETILGLEMTAKLESGSAKLDGKKLTVDYGIELEIDGPDGTMDGRIDYHFEGTRE